MGDPIQHTDRHFGRPSRRTGYDTHMDLMSAIVTLFLVMEPSETCAVPVRAEDRGTRRRRVVLLREIAFAYLVLVVFLLLGSSLLRFLGLEPEAVGIAGGIVLLR